MASSQLLRQSFSRSAIENPRFPRSLITQPCLNPCSSQTIITDCTPGVCQNLADTLQLMIVCNLLQNTNAGCNDCLNTPVLSCGCANAAPSFISSRGISPSVLSPSVISPSVISPNVISPSVFNAGCGSPVSVSNPFSNYLSLLG